MATILQRQDSVKSQPRRATPHDHITMRERHAARTVGPAKTAEKEHGRQAQRDGHDGGLEIAFVPVLVRNG